uniref:Translocation protein SEC62 n=1 Tax=Bionectria ochroleuca TaxID=29856 RepID=A0A0B7JHN8_BIOOC
MENDSPPNNPPPQQEEQILPNIRFPPGQQPTPEQIQQVQRKIAEDARKAGMTIPEFLEHLKKQAIQMRMAQQQQAQQAGHPVKRALRALESPAYEKARKKNPLLPAITDRASLENTFKLLPLSMLALRVSKVEQDPASGGKKAKRVKGQWTVKIEQHQEAKEELYYAWLWEGSQFQRQLYAALALVLIFTVVLYPLWPLVLRQGVYYLSWGLLGLLGLFFLMAIFRVILFCATYFIVPPGLWLYPNLWEDVSFMDSFRPVWAWHETEKPKKKKKSKAVKGSTNASVAAATGQVSPATAQTTGTDTQVNTEGVHQRQYVAPKVEELGDDE